MINDIRYIFNDSNLWKKIFNIISNAARNTHGDQLRGRTIKELASDTINRVSFDVTASLKPTLVEKIFHFKDDIEMVCSFSAPVLAGHKLIRPEAFDETYEVGTINLRAKSADLFDYLSSPRRHRIFRIRLEGACIGITEDDKYYLEKADTLTMNWHYPHKMRDYVYSVSITDLEVLNRRKKPSVQISGVTWYYLTRDGSLASYGFSATKIDELNKQTNFNMFNMMFSLDDYYTTAGDELIFLTDFLPSASTIRHLSAVLP